MILPSREVKQATTSAIKDAQHGNAHGAHIFHDYWITVYNIVPFELQNLDKTVELYDHRPTVYNILARLQESAGEGWS